MSRVVLSDIERFTAKRMIRIRDRTHLSAIESATNIRVAFRSSAPCEKWRSPLIWRVATRECVVCVLLNARLGGIVIVRIVRLSASAEGFGETRRSALRAAKAVAGPSVSRAVCLPERSQGKRTLRTTQNDMRRKPTAWQWQLPEERPVARSRRIVRTARCSAGCSSRDDASRRTCWGTPGSP